MSARFIHGQRLGSVPAARSSPVPRNCVMHGDCVDVMRGLPKASIDLVLTDPPYLCNYRDRSGRTVANDNDGAWLQPAFAQIARVLKPDSFCVSFYGWHQVDQFMAAWRAAGLHPLAHLVFHKEYASSQRYAAAHHECAYLLAKGKPPKPSEPPADVAPWQYTGNRLHPTQKPVSVLEPMVHNFCPRGGLVLDPFCGSGSTLVAAQRRGRDWLGIELDAEHHATAVDRMAKTPAA